MDTNTGIACWIVTLALFTQLYHLMNISKRVSANAFFMLAVALYLMAYNYYAIDVMFSQRVIHKLVNGSIALLIGVNA
jgi:hypothetical protein